MSTRGEPVAVVTGANSGIGRAIAIHLARQGYSVYGTVRSLDKATKLGAMAADAEVTVELAVVDVAVDDSVRDGLARALDEAGRIDVLVNNAGVGGNGTVEEAPIGDLCRRDERQPARSTPLPEGRAARHAAAPVGAIVNVS